MRGAHAAQHRSHARIIAVVAAVLIVIGGATAGAIQLFGGPGRVAARTAAADIQSPPSAVATPSTASPSTAEAAASTTQTRSASPAPPTPRPSHTPSPTHRPTTPPIASGTQAQREQVRELTNQQRQDNGDLAPLSMNSKLQAAAQAYAEHLAADGQFSHTDGSQLGDRITAAGYQWSAVGENLGLGQRSPAEIVAGWMNSPGHRANMLNADYVDAGVGIATRPDGQIIWCLDLGTPR